MRHLYIAGIERTIFNSERPDLMAKSLKIKLALTSQVDTLTCKIRGEKPEAGEEIIVTDDELGVMYKGIIDRVQLAQSFPEPVWQVDAQDYIYQLNRKLVVETYENVGASAIVLDIMNKYGAGFTTNNVRSGAPTIELLVFEYLPPSECLEQICQYVGWEYYVDFNRDLHFFSPEEELEAAPMLVEPGAYYTKLKASIDISSLRNRVYVRGGTMLSDPQVVQWKADGVARIWTLPWGPHEVSLQVGEVAKTVGVENLHEEANFDYMMNFNEKYIRCSAQAATPAAGTTISLTAKQDIDVITMVEDLESQTAITAVQGGDGVYEHSIVDDSLTTIQAAEAVGMADLREHANPKVKGSFETEYTKAALVTWGEVKSMTWGEVKS